MKQIKPDDLDPTHALDGFRLPPARRETPQELSHLLDGWRAEVAPAPRAPERLRGRAKANGQALAADVQDVHLAGPAPDVTVDLDGVNAALDAASVLAQGIGGHAFVEPTPLDPRDARDGWKASPGHPRILKHWQPGAWIGLRRRVPGANSVADGLVLEQGPAQWLLAVWPPQAEQPALPGRWPERALVADVQSRDAAGEALLEVLPEQAHLWIGDWDANWVLIAELVLQYDVALRPCQREALKEFVHAQRMANYVTLKEAYAPAPEGGAQRQK